MLHDRKASKTEGTSAIRKSLAILDLFSGEKRQWTVNEISSSLRLPQPTVSRIIAALHKEDYLERGDDHLYKLGWKCCRLGAVFNASVSITTLVMPVLRKIRDMFNETASLYIKRGIWRICISQAESTHALKRISTPGDQFPMWAGATGRCFMAYMNPQELAEVFESAPPHVQNHWDELMKKAESTKRNGFSTSIAEREAGISSIAAPIFDFSSLPVAALTVSGPSIRFTSDLVRGIVHAVLHESHDLSLRQGAPESVTDFTAPEQINALQ